MFVLEQFTQESNALSQPILRSVVDETDKPLTEEVATHLYKSSSSAAPSPFLPRLRLRCLRLLYSGVLLRDETRHDKAVLIKNV